MFPLYKVLNFILESLNFELEAPKKIEEYFDLASLRSINLNYSWIYKEATSE
jgi:hypothetical protein